VLRACDATDTQKRRGRPQGGRNRHCRIIGASVCRRSRLAHDLRVMKIIELVLLSLWEVFLNRCPRTGTSPRYGTCVRPDAGWSRECRRAHGLTVVHQHLGVMERVSIDGTFTPEEVTMTVPTLSLCTSRSRMCGCRA